MSADRSVEIGGERVGRGERRIVELLATRLYTGAELKIPVHVVRGRREGPRLFLCAALHGDEINGVEVIRRVLRLGEMEELRGTLIAVPVVNVFGFVQQSRYLPDRRDLNRSFPGSLKGSLAAQVARSFLDEVVDGSDLGIDLHTASHDRCNLPQVRIEPGDPLLEAMAVAFAPPVVLPGKAPRGTLRGAAGRRGTPVLVYEAGQALRFEEEAIEPGVRGVVGVMRELEMLPRSEAGRDVPPPLTATSSRWIRAPIGGVFRVGVELGARVLKGERLGTVSDPLGSEEEEVEAPAAGLIIGRLERPLVYRGEAVLHLADVEAPQTGSP